MISKRDSSGLIIIDLSVAIRAFLIATYCHLLPR
jgi:hypothetical protein